MQYFPSRVIDDLPRISSPVGTSKSVNGRVEHHARVESICGYCGTALASRGKDWEHVIPKALYPVESAPQIQRLTIRSCRECNVSLEDDEVHFRNALALAG